MRPLHFSLQHFCERNYVKIIFLKVLLTSLHLVQVRASGQHLAREALPPDGHAPDHREEDRVLGALPWTRATSHFCLQPGNKARPRHC